MTQVTHFKAQAESSLAERRTFQGKEYLVVPVVAMVEGVRFGANQSEPELGLATEFGSPAVLAAWNNRPLVVDHPQLDGVFVSANSIEVREQFEFGFTNNAYVEDSKLKMEAWIDLTVTAENDAVADFVAQIEAGETVEVSVGFFSDLEQRKGQFNGQAYGGVWRNIIPDHLAFLTNERGACSVEDGCGVPRINKGKEATMTLVADTPTVNKEDCGCGCGGTGACQTQAEPKAQAALQIQQIAGNLVSRDISSALRFTLHQYLQSQNAGLRYEFTDIYGFTTGDDSMVIFDAYIQDTGFVYEAVRFDMAEDLSVTFNGDIFPVRIVSQILTNEDSQENNMSTQTVNSAAEETTETAVETEATEATETTETVEAAAADVNEPAEQGDLLETQSSGISQMPKAVPLAQALTTLSSADREMVEDALKLHKDQKATAIKTLKETGRCKFSEAQLETLSMADLQNMLDLAGITANSAATEEPNNYAGRTVASKDDMTVNASSESEFVEAPRIFAKKEA